MLLNKTQLLDKNTPLSLRDISPRGGEKLLPFMEFLPPLGGVAEGLGGVIEEQKLT
jgi:hypothetical protein